MGAVAAELGHYRREQWSCQRDIRRNDFSHTSAVRSGAVDSRGERRQLLGGAISSDSAYMGTPTNDASPATVALMCDADAQLQTRFHATLNVRAVNGTSRHACDKELDG